MQNQEKKLTSEEKKFEKEKKKAEKRLKKEKLKEEKIEKTVYKRYNQLCKFPEKKEENLPSYWGSLNKKEKIRWLNENMLLNEILNYCGGQENGSK